MLARSPLARSPLARSPLFRSLLSLALVATPLLARADGPRSGSAAAGISALEYFPPEHLARRAGFAIAVVYVTRSTPGGTFGRPPKVEVQVFRTLAGQLPLDLPRGRVNALWNAPPSGIDWSGPSADAYRRQWSARPLAAPEVGRVYIALIGTDRGTDGLIAIEPALRELWSDAGEALWRARIAHPRRIDD